MKIVSFRSCHDNAAPVATGVVTAKGVLDVSAWIAAQPVTAEARERNAAAGIDAPAGGIMRLLQGGEAAARALTAYVDEAGNDPATVWHKLDDLKLYAPIPRPGKLIGVGRNYADHAKETGVDPFEKPRIIFKMPSAVSAPGASVPRPEAVTKMDYEAELAVVIGGYGRNISEQAALSLVAGYTVLNDLSAREFQFDVSPAQTTFAKSVDGFAPMGPWMVTRDEVPDPQALDVSCWLNGERVQHANTRDMLFPVATLISYLSQYMTLEPGDVLTTGTPAGIGAFRQPPVYLQPGDVLRCEVSGVGVLQNRVV